MQIRALLPCTLSFLLAACGGGGNSGVGQSSDSGGNSGGTASASAGATSSGTPAGLYRGTTSNGRSLAGIVLEDGEYWLLYTPIGNSTLIAGAEQGHATFAGGSFSSSDLKDFNLERLGISNGTASGSYTPNSSVSGTVIFSASQVSFSASYDPVSAAPSNLAGAAGTFSGSAATLGGTEAATLTLAPNGAFSGISQHGCRFSGAAMAHSTGSVYALIVTFAGGVCANGTSTVDGVAFYDSATRRVYAAALTPTRSNGFIFAGGK